MHRVASSLQLRSRRGAEPAGKPVDAAAEFVFRGKDHLGRRRGCRRAKVRDEVRDRHVRFVSDRRHHGNRTGHDRASDALLIERPEILDRSAATSDDHDVYSGNFDDHPQRGRDVSGGIFSLHARGTNQNARIRRAPLQYLENVAQRRAVKRRDDADAAGQGGQRALPRGVEKPLRLQLLLQLLERELERAKAVRLHVLADDLVFPLRLVDAEPAARDDMESVLGLEPQIADRRTEHDRLDLRAAILQREIHVPRIPHFAVRDFSLEPHLTERVLNQRADACRQLADGVHVPHRGLCRTLWVRVGLWLCVVLVCVGLWLRGFLWLELVRRLLFERDVEQIHGQRSAVCGASASMSAVERLRRWKAVARPVARSAVTMTPLSRPGPAADSNFTGSPVTKRVSAISVVTPMIESCGPVIPASVMYAVPLGRIQSSAVCTCVCVPNTPVTRPSRCHPIATFSDVASAWKSTMMTRAFARSASISLSTTVNGSSSGCMKIRPITLTTPIASPLRVRPR